jgi:hypothetical protein
MFTVIPALELVVLPPVELVELEPGVSRKYPAAAATTSTTMTPAMII